MRRCTSLLSIIIALAMAFCAPAALADDAVDKAPAASEGQTDGIDMVEHTSVTGMFRYELPADMVVMNGATKSSLLSTVDIELLMNTYGMSKQEVSDILDYVLEEDCSEYDLIYSADFIGVLHILFAPDCGITPDDLPYAQETLDEMYTSEYVDIGASEDNCVPHGIITVGENHNKWYKFSAIFNGSKYVTYLTSNDAGDMFRFDFCDFSEEQALAIIESVELLDADEAPSKDADDEAKDDDGKAEDDDEAKSDDGEAEAPIELKDYTSVTGLFACQIPDDMIVLSDADKETLADTIYADYAVSELGIDEDTVEQLLSGDYTGLDYMCTADLNSIITAQVTPDSGITPSTFEMSTALFDTMFTAMYVQAGADEDDCESFGVITVGENPNSWYKFAVSISSQTIAQYITRNDDGDMIAFTFINMPEEQALAVIESVELMEGEAD